MTGFADWRDRKLLRQRALVSDLKVEVAGHRNYWSVVQKEDRRRAIPNLIARSGSDVRTVRSVISDPRPAIAQIQTADGVARLRFRPLALSEKFTFSARSTCECVRRAPRRMSSEHLSEQIGEGFVAVIAGRFPRERVVGAGRNRAKKAPFSGVLRGGVKKNRRSRKVPRGRPARTGEGADQRW
jgi:hypothetical protein